MTRNDGTKLAGSKRAARRSGQGVDRRFGVNLDAPSFLPTTARPTRSRPSAGGLLALPCAAPQEARNRACKPGARNLSRCPHASKRTAAHGRTWPKQPIPRIAWKPGRAACLVTPHGEDGTGGTHGAMFHGEQNGAAGGPSVPSRRAAGALTDGRQKTVTSVTRTGGSGFSESTINLTRREMRMTIAQTYSRLNNGTAAPFAQDFAREFKRA